MGHHYCDSKEEEWGGLTYANVTHMIFDMGLTPKQKQVLGFISQFQKRKGYSPSQTEIATHFGFRSLGTVQNYLVRLQKQGFLQKNLNEKRGLQLSDPEEVSDAYAGHDADQTAAAAVSIPLYGRVAAGSPIEAVRTPDVVDVPASLLRKGEHYALKVKGDSMIEEGIFEGDTVIIKRQETASNGETVVALIDNEATIKKYYRRGDQVELRPGNAAYKPIYVEPASGVSFKIEGIMVGLIRSL